MQLAELWTRSALWTCPGEIIQVRRNNTRAPLVLTDTYIYAQQAGIHYMRVLRAHT